MGGSLTEQEIKDILNIFPKQKLKYFIETGTYLGTTTRLASTIFDYVYTMEIVQQLYDESRAYGGDNITYLLGDTIKLLPTIIPKIDAPAMWFLDSHQSGPETSNNGKWVPLLDELNIILSSYKYPSIYIIDDLRLFSKHWDWADVSIESILDCFKKNGKEIAVNYSNNDRYIIITKN